MLRTNDDGTLDVRSVDELAPANLNQWVWDRLHEADLNAPNDPRQNVGQYYLVGAIYPVLAPATQAELRRILRRFLVQMEAEDYDWQGDAGDALLLLVMKVGEPELAAPIRRMAEREVLLDGDAPNEDQHARLVQALADLGEKVTPDFWKQQVQRDPDRYLAVAFAGLRLYSVYQALGLLCGVEALSEDLKVRVYPVLRGLLRRPGTTLDDLRAVICDMETVLSPAVWAFVRETLPEVWNEVRNGAEPATTAPASDRLSEARARLALLGHDPEPASLAYSQTA